MKPVVCIPWRSEDPQRQRSFGYVTHHLKDIGLEVVAGGGDMDAPFNRGAAKNALADYAISSCGADVIVFHDADMVLPSRDAYDAMINQAATSGRLVVGFTDYHALSRAATAHVIKGMAKPERATVEATLTAFSVGGIIAISTRALLEVGGYDERFRGWGCEDFAFKIACHTVLGDIVRMAGPAYHLWHEHGSASQSNDDDRWNAELLGHYNTIRSVEDLRALQEGVPDGMR